MDGRIEEWAENLVEYSMNVREGDVVSISYGYPARELAKAVFLKVLERGGHPVVDLDDEEFSRLFYENAEEDQLEHVPAFLKQKVEETDASLRIRAPMHTKELANVAPERMQVTARAREGLKEEIIENTRWSLTQFPTRALAQEAEMSLDEYREFVFRACVKDWEEESRRYMELKELVDEGREVRIQGHRTDLTFSIGQVGRIKPIGVLSDGTSNVPGGEVFTAPVKDSVNGEIFFELPAVTAGREVKGVWLRFEDGRVVEFSAEKNEDLLEERLDTDEGSRFLGEFGIGTNFDIDRFTRNILFDEKIGGTVHLALGSAYRDCFRRLVDLDEIRPSSVSRERADELAVALEEALRGGEFGAKCSGLDENEQEFARLFAEAWKGLEDEEKKWRNRSAVHWDMIKDLRESGSMSIDGETIIRDGEFVGVEGL